MIRSAPIFAVIAAIVVAVPTFADDAPTYDQIPQVKEINKQIKIVWDEYEIKPSPRATDGEWCRRVYLDILGRIPSYQELKAFVTSTDADKKSKLVNTLLYDEEFTEEYARNWTTIWTNVLIGRSAGTDDDDMVSREGMQKYLRDSFARNKPYNQMVRELVSATGTTTPGDAKFNGATNFLIDKLEEDAAQATADVSKHFLGLQVQCTQCHNHPFNEWKQQKFWEFNAFFRQTAAMGSQVPPALINQDFAGEGDDPSEAEVYYELRNGLLEVAYPVFVDGTAISKSGYLSDVDRRSELARIMMGSEFLDKMIANRMWAHFMGYGFTKPIDDLGPHNAPSHPVLLDYLGKEVRKNSYNLKEVIRWITLSEAYGLSSKMTTANKMDDPLMGEPPKFSHFYIRQMSAEQLYESLLVATQAHKTRGSYEEEEKTKSQWLQQFVTAFGTDEGGEATTFNGTIPQALMMFNGDLVKKATSQEKGSFLSTIAASKLSPGEKINYLFMAGLARRPSRDEMAVANSLLVARKGDYTAALQDIWWAVLNSNEFIFNH